MKKFHHHFIHHLRSYRTFHFLFFTFILLLTAVAIYIFSNKIYAEDLLEKAFEPAFKNETIINLWEGKNAVGNEVLREGVNVQDNAGQWCFVNNQHITDKDLTLQKAAVWYNWSDTSTDNRKFCEEILWWDYNTTILQTEAPLIVRIAKFLLRITMVLAVTMVIFNGIMWIIESAKWAEVKDAKKNMVLLVVGILIALMSLSIINLISSLSISSLQSKTTNTPASCLIDWNTLVGDNLKKYMCEKLYAGRWYGDRIGDRCRVNYYKDGVGNFDQADAYRGSISDTQSATKCVELWGIYTK